MQNVKKTEPKLQISISGRQINTEEISDVDMGGGVKQERLPPPLLKNSMSQVQYKCEIVKCRFTFFILPDSFVCSRYFIKLIAYIHGKSTVRC